MSHILSPPKQRTAASSLGEGAWRGQVVAVLAVSIGVVMRLALLGSLGTRAAFLTLYPAVIAAALYGGLGAGLSATCLSAVAAGYFWANPGRQWRIDDQADAAALVVFLCSGIFISWIFETRRKAQMRAIAAEAEAAAAHARQFAAEAISRAGEESRFIAGLLENSELAMTIGYPDGRIGICNQAFCRLTGYSAEELREMKWSSCLTPSEWEQAETAALADLESTGKPVRYVKEYIRKDGTRVPIELLVHAGRDAAGKLHYYYAFVTDITERNRVENEVRRQREWLRVTLASIGDAVLTTDLQGRITLLNPAAERLTGWVESEALGRPAGDVFRIINEQSRKPAEDIIGRTLREGNVAWLGPHTILVSRNGTEYPIEDSAAPILAEGVVSGVVVVFHDVSERLRTQRTLQSSQAQLHTVLDTLTEGLVVSTLDGEVILWNRSGLEMHGYASLKEALGHLADFGRAFELATMEGKVLPVDEWPLARILRGELLRDVELRVRRLDMDLHRVVSFGGALARDPDGKPLMAVVSLRDITAKKRDEQALRESESRMRALGDNLPEGAVFRYIQDRAGATRFEFISAGIESIGGVSREEAMRDAALALDTIVPEDRLRYLEAAQTSRQELTRFELEIRIRNRKTGEVHWCLIRSEPRQSPDGVVWDGVLLDVTARKGLEEQLRQRVEELEALMDVAPVAVWSAQDPACLEITGNRMANAFYDADAGENVSATTTPVRRFFQNGRELLPDELPMQQAAALNCEVRGSEVEVLLPSGRRLHILGHASPLHDMTGRVRGCVGAFLDITERKHAEERLRRSEAMYRAVARSLPDGGVAVVDMDLRLVVLEGSLLARIGIEAGSFEGRQVEEAIDATRAALASPVFYRRALAGESIANETSYAGRILSCRHAPLRDEQGVVIGAMSLFLDVTERRRSEEQFRQAQKLESIGLLAGGVAHDFNNLLTAIMGNASLMAEDALPTQSELLDGIINSAGKAAHLTRQLLAYSGKGQFLVKNLNLTHCLVEMRDLIRLSVPKSVELRFNTREQLPLVSMDPGQFQQIAMNLIINAGEAIGEGCRGTISIATGLFDAERPFRDAVGEEIAAGRYVYLQVEDTGPGMDEATKLRIFDPFFTTKFTGRGLGLAAVSGIVRSQRGAISVESTVRKGSVFRVLFSGLHSGMHEADHEPAPVRGRAVLVVDDEEAVRRFLVMALRKHGYQVHQAADGREALALFDRLEERVDAVVLDIVMPVMGASDFIPEIKQRRPDLKVLLTSGYNESEAKRLCSAYEGSAFIQKPYTAQQLAAAIEKLLDADERS